MGKMRDNIKAMMEREVDAAPLRAVSSRRRARKLAGRRHRRRRRATASRSPMRKPRISLASRAICSSPARRSRELEPALQGAAEVGDILIRHDDDVQATGDILLADGRWLRISHSPTPRRRLHRRVQRYQPAQDTGSDAARDQLRLDAALDNMSQGLCLFDAQNRLQMFNRRFCEIFNLPARSHQARHGYRRSDRDQYRARQSAGSYRRRDCLTEQRAAASTIMPTGPHFMRTPRRPRHIRVSIARPPTAAGS